MSTALTPEQAHDAFAAVAARGDEIAFRWLQEGCECRAHLMIPILQALGITPGRAWAISVGRPLTYPAPNRPGKFYKWFNHVAPTVPVKGAEYDVLVIDPSLSLGGPVTLREWAALMSARAIVVSTTSIPEEQVLHLQATNALQGVELDAVLFALPLGVPPLTNRGGTGFAIADDPAGDLDAYVQEHMQDYLDNQKKLPKL